MENDPIRHILAPFEWNVCSIIAQAAAFEKGLRHFIFFAPQMYGKERVPAGTRSFFMLLVFYPHQLV